MPSRVTIHADGYVELTQSGNQTSESVRKTIQQLRQPTVELRDSGQPVKVLVDITRLGKSEAATRKIAREAISEAQFDRIAIFGSDVVSRTTMNLIAYAAGKSHQIKTFATREEAVEWLQNYGRE